MNFEHLKFPIGRFNYDPNAGSDIFERWKSVIHHFPNDVREELAKMSDIQLNTAYRPEGWTARQVIHHVADSHSHALLRFKTALTEDKPTIKPYLEAKYSLLEDYKLPVESAISILQGVHQKWYFILESMNNVDWDKGYFHPETGKFFTLHNALALYAWHCGHHLGHLKICSNL